jgi:hypothetical protein
VGKKSSIAFGVVGVVLVILAIVWWAVIAPSLVKLPSDLDTKMDFEGNLTYYVDPATGAPLAAGQEKVVPFTVLRTFSSKTDLYTSSMAVCEDKIVMSVGGQERPAQITQYALDRKTRKCVESDQNWAYDPKIVLPDRVGNYGPIFPGGLAVGDTLSTFFNDVNKAFEVKVAEKIDDFEGLGITAMKIDATRPAAAYYPAIAQAFLGSQGLPMEITFAQLSAQLKAKGLDLEALLAGLAQVAAPEDLQALQAMTQQPVKVVYQQAGADMMYVEQKTGATVGATFDRTTTMQIDTSGLLQAFMIIGKYASDPTVGPAISKVMQAAGGLASAEPSKVFNQKMSIIKTSEATLAADAQSKGALVNWAKLGIPLIIVIVGALLVLLACFVFMRTRKKAA